MSRTTCYLLVAQQGSTAIAENVSRGSDWNDTLPAGTIIQAYSLTLIGTLGDPGPSESDHWGWLYFNSQITGKQVSLQAYICETSDQISSAKLGFYDSGSQKDNPMPSGECGLAIISKGAVYYILFGLD